MTHEVVRRLRRGVPGDAAPSDEQLLTAYRAGADPVALDALVRRHAPMVWGVCRRVAGPDAEDAFQAAFLVLVRRAAAIDRPHLLGNWLYGVASRTARKARAAAGRRRTRETDLAQTDPPAPAPGPWDDVLPLLDEELARLPERYRAALVLCDLQGKTRREAAELTGTPAGTIAARVARGRALLATRLARRGVGVPAAVVAALLARDAWARVPIRLLNAAVRAPGGSVPSRAAALSDRVVNAMLLTRLAATTGRFFGLAAGLALTVVVTTSVAGQPPADPPQPPAQPAAPPRPPAPGWREPFVLTHDHPVTSLACSATRLAAADAGANLFLCDPLTGKNRVRKLKGAPPDTPNALRDYDQLAFTADEKKLFMIRQERSSVWFTLTDNGDEKAWGVGGGGTRFLDFSADTSLWLEGHGKVLVVRPNAYAPDALALERPADYLASARYDTDVLLAALAPDGARYAVATAGGRIHMPILRAGEIQEGTRPSNTVTLDNQKVTALRFSPDGAKLAAVGDSGFARVYEAKTGKELVTLKGHSGIVFCTAFSPDGTTLVTAGDDNVVRLWEAATGRLRAELKGHTDAVRAAEFAPSGRRLYTASPDKTVRAWAPPR